MDLKDRIEEVLANKVRPMLSHHGGGVEVAEVDEDKGIAKLKFSGVCLGCPYAGDTFEGIIKQELLSEVEDLKDVVSVNEIEKL